MFCERFEQRAERLVRQHKGSGCRGCCAAEINVSACCAPCWALKQPSLSIAFLLICAQVFVPVSASSLAASCRVVNPCRRPLFLHSHVLPLCPAAPSSCHLHGPAPRLSRARVPGRSSPSHACRAMSARSSLVKFAVFTTAAAQPARAPIFGRHCPSQHTHGCTASPHQRGGAAGGRSHCVTFVMTLW